MKITATLLFIIVIFLISPVAAQQSWCGIQDLMFEDNSSGITPIGYMRLINYPSGKPEVDANITISASDGSVLIVTFILPDGVLASTNELLAGVRHYTIYAYTSGTPGEDTLSFTAFRRFGNGTEQDFYTTTSVDINAETVTKYDLDYISPVTLELNPTDRLGIKVRGHTTHASPITIHFVYQGIEHASYFQSGYFLCEEGQIQNPAINASATPMSPATSIVAGILAAVILLALNVKKD